MAIKSVAIINAVRRAVTPDPASALIAAQSGSTRRMPHSAPLPGRERDMVIFDTVNAAPLAPRVLLAGKGAASSATNLINVSISRARGKLVVIADVAYFKQHDADSVVSQVLRGAMIETGTTVRM